MNIGNDTELGLAAAVKNSWIGRFKGMCAIAVFTTDHQWITVQHTPHQYPFDSQEIK